MEDIWVSGQIVIAVAESLGNHKDIGLAILANHGIKNPTPESWYPQRAWLESLQEIKNDIGPGTLLVIGKKIPEKLTNLAYLFEDETIDRALSHINILYHLTHKKGNQILYDETNETFLDAAGSIKYERIAPNKVRLACLNPYPAEINKGIIIKIARMYDPLVEIDNEKPDAINTFIVTWNN